MGTVKAFLAGLHQIDDGRRWKPFRNRTGKRAARSEVAALTRTNLPAETERDRNVRHGVLRVHLGIARLGEEFRVTAAQPVVEA